MTLISTVAFFLLEVCTVIFALPSVSAFTSPLTEMLATLALPLFQV